MSNKKKEAEMFMLKIRQVNKNVKFSFDCTLLCLYLVLVLATMMLLSLLLFYKPKV